MFYSQTILLLVNVISNKSQYNSYILVNLHKLHIKPNCIFHFEAKVWDVTLSNTILYKCHHRILLSNATYRKYKSCCNSISPFRVAWSSFVSLGLLVTAGWALPSLSSNFVMFEESCGPGRGHSSSHPYSPHLPTPCSPIPRV